MRRRSSPTRSTATSTRAFAIPTVRLFQDRLAALEGAEACLSHGLRNVGDPVGAHEPDPRAATTSSARWACSARRCSCSVCSSATACAPATSPLTDLAAWEAAIEPTTRFLFLETPANPLDRGRRPRVARRTGAPPRRAAGGRQLLLHAGAAAAAGVGRRHRRPFGHQVPRRTGPGARRRRARAHGLREGEARAGAALTAARRCRRSTPGSWPRGWRRCR